MHSNPSINSESVIQTLKQTAQFMSTNGTMGLLIHPLTIKVNQVQTAGLIPQDTFNANGESLKKRISRRYAGLQTTMLGVMARSAGTVNYPIIKKKLHDSIPQPSLAMVGTVTVTSSIDTICGAYPSNAITFLVTKHQQQFQATLKACQSRWHAYGYHLQLGTMGITSRFARNWINSGVLIAVFPVMKEFYQDLLAKNVTPDSAAYVGIMANTLATVNAAAVGMTTNMLDVIHRTRIAKMHWQTNQHSSSARTMQIAPFFQTTASIWQDYGWRRFMAGADKSMLCTIIAYTCINGMDHLFNRQKGLPERQFFKPKPPMAVDIDIKKSNRHSQRSR